jgi:hypothetical protein
MKYLLLLVIFAIIGSTFAAECHPDCRWQCDDPVCPAVCHPVCERPKCEISCDETPCAKCQVHCEPASCSVRCPKDMCEKDNCPKCETVCQPARCHTTCQAPEPTCNPVCEDTKCEWKCKKPTLCPKPKCELVCEKSKCAAEEAKCCDCTNAAHAGAAVQNANQSQTPAQQTTTQQQKPSFLEVMHEMRFKDKAQKSMCCPCAH